MQVSFVSELIAKLDPHSGVTVKECLVTAELLALDKVKVIQSVKCLRKFIEMT